MALISGFSTAGLVQNKLHLNIHNHHRIGSVDHITQSVSVKVPKTKLQYSVAAASRSKTALRAGVNQYQPSYNNDYVEESFWLKLVKETFWALKSLFTFLLEQPSQLQYIEWPSFQSTLKTATLTLVLVALLIVALASVDSALAFLLALLLRKPA